MGEGDVMGAGVMGSDGVWWGLVVLERMWSSGLRGGVDTYVEVYWLSSHHVKTTN